MMTEMGLKRWMEDNEDIQETLLLGTGAIRGLILKCLNLETPSN